MCFLSAAKQEDGIWQVMDALSWDDRVQRSDDIQDVQIAADQAEGSSKNE